MIPEMNGKHRKTYQKMIQHPRPSNLLWSDVESLLKACGAQITERKGSAISVEMNGHIAVFHRPHPGKDADKGAIANAIQFLHRIGCNPLEGKE
jgi:hypothetical protein